MTAHQDATSDSGGVWNEPADELDVLMTSKWMATPLTSYEKAFVIAAVPQEGETF